MVNWATTVVPVIVATIGVITPIFLALLNTYSNQIYSKPNLKIAIEPDNNDSRSATIRVTNYGVVAATNVSLIIQTPKKIDNITDVFNTTKIEPLPLHFKENSLTFHIPKLPGGHGSVIEIKTLIDANRKEPYYNYTGYAVYDQGSTFGEPEKPLEKLNSIYDILNYVIDRFSILITVVLMYPLIFSYFRTFIKLRMNRKRFVRSLIADLIRTYIILSRDPLTRKDIYISWLDINNRFIYDVKDYVLLTELSSKIGDRNYLIHKSNDINDVTLTKINKEILDLATKALEQTEWKRYGAVSLFIPRLEIAEDRSFSALLRDSN